MQIINDTEVFEPSECYFVVMPDPEDAEHTMVLITDKVTWDEEQCLNDSIGDHSFQDGVIPETMWNCMEATWETDISVEEARSAMQQAGFVENADMLAHFSEE